MKTGIEIYEGKEEVILLAESGLEQDVLKRIRTAHAKGVNFTLKAHPMSENSLVISEKLTC